MRPILGLLLVLGALAPGCSDDGLPGQDEDAGDGTTSSTTGSVGTTSSGTSSGGEGGTTGGSDSTTSGSGSSSGTDGDTTSGSTGDSGSDSSGSGSTTGEAVSPCVEGCATEFACTMDWPSEEECVIACEANLVKAGMFHPACQAAWEGVHACLGTLTCEEFAEWQAPTALPYPCSDADILLEIECEGQ